MNTKEVLTTNLIMVSPVCVVELSKVNSSVWSIFVVVALDFWSCCSREHRFGSFKNSKRLNIRRIPRATLGKDWGIDDGSASRRRPGENYASCPRVRVSVRRIFVILRFLIGSHLPWNSVWLRRDRDTVAFSHLGLMTYRLSSIDYGCEERNK